jgi:hypothetical protein
LSVIMDLNPNTRLCTQLHENCPVPSTIPSNVAARNRITGCWTRRWIAVTTWPVLRSYQWPIERFGYDPELDR